MDSEVVVQDAVEKFAAGAKLTARTSKYGGALSADRNARYMEAVLRGGVFLGANTGVQALSLNSATATGLILTNPKGSNVRAVLLEVCIAIASLPAGQSALILTGSPDPGAAQVTHTTALTPRNALWGKNAGGSGGACLLDSAATIPAATIARVIGAGTAATVAASTAFPPLIRDEIAGLIVLEPGTVISLQALTTAVSVVASIAWEEVPL